MTADREQIGSRDAEDGGDRARPRGDHPNTSTIRPQWLQRVNAAMDLPVGEGRAALDEIAAERRQRAEQLRARAVRDDTSAEHRLLFGRMAAWVDDSADQVAQARDRLAQIEAAGEVATGREQIARETRRGRSL